MVFSGFERNFKMDRRIGEGGGKKRGEIYASTVLERNSILIRTSCHRINWSENTGRRWLRGEKDSNILEF